MTIRPLITASLASVALALGACGSDDEGKPIPRNERAALDSRLREIEDRFENGTAGACKDIEDDSEPAVRQILASTPRSVGSDVRAALEDSFDRLFDLVRSDCANDEETQTETIELPPPVTQPPETTPPKTEPQTQTQPPPQTQPQQDNGNGNDGGGAEAPGLVLPKKGKKK